MNSRLLTLILLALLSAGCDGTPDFVADGLDSRLNFTVFIPNPRGGAVTIVDTIGADSITRLGIDSRPPISGSFALTCNPGRCVRFNLFLRNPERTGWAAGLNCEQLLQYSPIWPIMVKGPVGSMRPALVCCPHNEPCNLDRVSTPNNSGGADWIVGVLPNGRAATNLVELRSICPEDLEGAVEYDPSVFGRFTYSD